MNARLLTTVALAMLMTSTIACSRKKKTEDSSHPAAQAKAEAAPDCSNFFGAWQLQSSIVGEPQLKTVTFFNNAGEMSVKIEGQADVYVIDGKSHDYPNAVVASGECTHDGMLVVRQSEKQDGQARNGSQAAPYAKQWVFVSNGKADAMLTAQVVTKGPDGKDLLPKDVGSSAISKGASVDNVPVAPLQDHYTDAGPLPTN